MAVPSNSVSRQGISVLSDDQINTLVQGCTTAAQLRTFSGLSNMAVTLLGIGSVNDGGGGVFYWANGSGFVDDDYNVIVPQGTTTGAWLRASLQTAPVTAAFSFLGTSPPLASEVIGLWVAPVPVTFPTNFAGALGNDQNLPTATFVAFIYQSNIVLSIGTMTISTSGAFTFATSGPISLLAGQAIEFRAPASPDATIGNFAWTLVAASAP